jgi:hypothetical protein
LIFAPRVDPPETALAFCGKSRFRSQST